LINLAEIEQEIKKKNKQTENDVRNGKEHITKDLTDVQDKRKGYQRT